MADADSRAKRQSAACILLPFMLIGVYPDTAAVDSEERWAITWMYSGIAVGSAVAVVRNFNPIFIIITEEERCP